MSTRMWVNCSQKVYNKTTEETDKLTKNQGRLVKIWKVGSVVTKYCYSSQKSTISQKHTPVLIVLSQNFQNIP